MAYSVGGLVQASDINGMISNNTDNLLRVWGTGSGNYGYGQDTTGITTVSQNDRITAVPNRTFTEVYANATPTGTTTTVANGPWAATLSAVNKARRHQSSTFTNIVQPTTGTSANPGPENGNPVSWLTGLATAITDANTNRLTAATDGTTNLGAANTIFPTANLNQSLNTNSDTTVTFQSIDQARYFFNCGGYLVLNLTAFVTNGTARSQAIVDAINGTRDVTGVVLRFRASSNSGHLGGGIATDNTGIGYYGLTTTWTPIVTESGTGAYTTSSVTISVSSDDTSPGANAGNGRMVKFRINFNVPADPVSGVPGDPGGGDCSFGMTWSVDYVEPEITNLSNSWGTITVA
jgi:hypothetical protein